MFGLQYMHKMAQFFRVSVGYLMGYESSPYTGLTKEEREHFDKENEDEHFKRLEQQNQNLDEYGMEQVEKTTLKQSWISMNGEIQTKQHTLNFSN